MRQLHLWVGVPYGKESSPEPHLMNVIAFFFSYACMHIT